MEVTLIRGCKSHDDCSNLLSQGIDRATLQDAVNKGKAKLPPFGEKGKAELFPKEASPEDRRDLNKTKTRNTSLTADSPLTYVDLHEERQSGDRIRTSAPPTFLKPSEDQWHRLDITAPVNEISHSGPDNQKRTHGGNPYVNEQTLYRLILAYSYYTNKD